MGRQPRGQAITRPISAIAWLRKLVKELGVHHRFSVTNSAWTNRTVERMMREAIHGAKAMLNEVGRPVNEWVVVRPAVQWALKTAWRKQLQATPYHVMTGREPGTAFPALIEGGDEGFQFSPIDEDGLQQLVVLWWIPRKSSWQGG